MLRPERRLLERADVDGLRLTLDEIERSRNAALSRTQRSWLLVVWLVRWCGFTIPVIALTVWWQAPSSDWPIASLTLYGCSTAASLIFALHYRSTSMSPERAEGFLALSSWVMGVSMGILMIPALHSSDPRFTGLLCLTFTAAGIAMSTLTTSFVPGSFVGFAVPSVGLEIVCLFAYGTSFGYWLGAGAIVVLGSMLIVGRRLHVLLRESIERRIAQEELSSQLSVALDQLDRIAATDELTGVANRRRFIGLLERCIAEAATVSTCIVLFDIDHFKSVNDRFGHGVGDEVLRHVAAAIRASLRAGDLVGRVGGEEFAILCSTDGEHTAEIMTERLRQRVADIVLDEVPELRVTASFGIAQILPSYTAADALDAADQPLYRAKREGRNTIRSAGNARPTDAVAQRGERRFFGLPSQSIAAAPTTGVAAAVNL